MPQWLTVRAVAAAGTASAATMPNTGPPVRANIDRDIGDPPLLPELRRGSPFSCVATRQVSTFEEWVVLPTGGAKRRADGGYGRLKLTSSIRPLYQSPPIDLAPIVSFAVLEILPSVTVLVKVWPSTTSRKAVERLTQEIVCHWLSASTGPAVMLPPAELPCAWQNALPVCRISIFQ